MSIKKNFDVVGQEAPSPDSGTNFFDNPGIQPSMKDIPDTAGEKATNQTTPYKVSNSIPAGKKGGRGLY